MARQKTREEFIAGYPRPRSPKYDTEMLRILATCECGDRACTGWVWAYYDQAEEGGDLPPQETLAETLEEAREAARLLS